MNDNGESTGSDGTSMWARPEAQHSVAAGMLLNNVHTAIVQIYGVDEMDTETTIEYGTTPSKSYKLGNSRDVQDDTEQNTSDPTCLAVDYCPTKNSKGGVNDINNRGDEKVPPCLSNVPINTVIDWQKDRQEELIEILRMHGIHVVPLWKSLQPCVPPVTMRDAAYQQVFAPFRDVQEL